MQKDLTIGTSDLQHLISEWAHGPSAEEPGGEKMMIHSPFGQSKKLLTEESAGLILPLSMESDTARQSSEPH